MYGLRMLLLPFFSRFHAYVFNFFFSPVNNTCVRTCGANELWARDLFYLLSLLGHTFRILLNYSLLILVLWNAPFRKHFRLHISIFKSCVFCWLVFGTIHFNSISCILFSMFNCHSYIPRKVVDKLVWAFFCWYWQQIAFW